MSRFPRPHLGQSDPQEDEDPSDSESAPLTGATSGPSSSSEAPTSSTTPNRLSRNPPVFSNFSLPHRPPRTQKVKIATASDEDEVLDTFIEDPQLAHEQSIPLRKIMHSHSRQASKSSIRSPRTRRPGHSRNSSRGSVMSLFSNDGDDVLFGKEDDDDGSSVGTPTMGGRRVRRVRWHTGDTPLEGSRRNSFDGGDGLGGEFMWSKEAEKRVVRKFDWYLVGWMAALYTMSFLDRSNIGNARLAGLQDDLELSPNQWEWLLTAFYISYIGFEWMTLLWKVFPASTYVPLCVAGWGVTAVLQSLSWNFASMLTLRFLLGIVEAAFGPGVPFYLSFFYRREELALRVGLFISAAPLATAYAGTLAWLITSIPTSIAPWRLLLIAEGFPSLIMAAISYYWIPDRPSTAFWLKTSDERKIARRRLLVVTEGDDNEEDRDEASLGDSRRINWSQALGAIKSPRNWLTALIFFSCNISFASLPVFMPTIIHSLGHSALASQALSAPPYILAFLSILLTTYLSDLTLQRSPFLIFHALLTSISYLLLALLPHHGIYLTIKYILLFPVTAGLFSCISLAIPWMLNNEKGGSAKGAGMVLLNVVGQMGPLVGTRVYPEGSGPEYRLGMGVCGGAMAVVVVCTVVVRGMLKRANGEGGKEWKFIL